MVGFCKIKLLKCMFFFLINKQEENEKNNYLTNRKCKSVM